MPLYKKQYKCSVCGNEWEDIWDCLCDDRCPECNVATECSSYEEIRGNGNQ